MSAELPPKRRNWKEGTPQIGAFLRTRQGSTIALVNDKGTDDQEALVLAIIMGPQKMPPETMKAVRDWVDSQIKRKET